MKISHEVPLDLLKSSTYFNDYYFCLPYYYVRNNEYKNYYLNRDKSKICILDCGLFEGELLEDDRLLEIINEVKPTYFIIPDVWNKDLDSLNNAKKWINNYKNKLPKETELMGVIQCTDLEIGTKLYLDYLELGLKAISFNHSSEAYDLIFPHPNKSISKSLGRIYFINNLYNNKIIDSSVYHHLLGCNSSLELSTYKSANFSFINSVDTSNPIIFGCKEIKYNISNMWDKPKEKIEEFFYNELTPEQLICIYSNIKIFRELI